MHLPVGDGLSTLLRLETVAATVVDTLPTIWYTLWMRCEDGCRAGSEPAQVQEEWLSYNGTGE
ncbi:hypothetical protein PF005_g29615 [Phytophthora fragariae]|uniref:Uncharacterized protein n=2 Tax=Phytophthora TaxID=4783 RepID=A0A6A3PNM5_9STRA|nr:hypothetical protein PF003_g7048 [Phytophthora fragariae]KAE8962686.1 hypothetical protein PR001_g29631 [Phytophthora rubi]KAE8919170.1 hypothetical protein PF009_g30517 [Phytophthora fragariae]KAE8962549.1 hypothetical protein PF011_g29343 [Phytophthora fragariae]KAE9061282.1 hypothetical protein PF010_g29873 [Phytophthora fragariae]